MPEESRPTRLVKLLQEEMERRYKILVKEWEIPFGMEKVTPEEYRRRFNAMTPEQRLAEIERLGVEKVMAIMAKEG